MNNIVANFDQTLTLGQDYGSAVNKTRGVLREYLQSSFISRLYALPKSEKLSFVGGTSLRLLRGLNRFSEDLDFDNLGLSDEKVVELISEVTASFHRENVTIELLHHKKEFRTYFEIRFPSLLQDLHISKDPKEKVMIKIDYANFWQGQKTETILFSRFGFIEQVVTNTMNNLMVQKIAAYVQRKETQPRDLYDIVWLFGQNARFDYEFAKQNDLADIIQRAQTKFEKEGVTQYMKNKLRPFLFQEETVGKIGLLGNVLAELTK